MTTMTEPTTATIEAPGAVLTYDIRRSDSTTEPALFLLGSPMGAGGFATLASHFPDRTIVTYDPRGVERSVKADPATVSTPEQHADDIHRVIAAVGGPGRPVRQQRRRGECAGPRGEVPGRRPHARRARAPARVDPARPRERDGGHPGDRRHLPAQWLRAGDGPVHPRGQPPGRDDARIRRPARAGSGDVRAAHRGRRQPHRPAPLPEHHDLHALRARLRRAAGGPDPDRVGGRQGVDGSDGPSRRRGRRRAPRPGRREFPSDHGGFLGGEYGQAGEPDAFAAKLREVLAEG